MAGEQQQLSNVAQCLQSQKVAAVLRESEVEERGLGLFCERERWRDRAL
jgi:hypothetical protein